MPRSHIKVPKVPHCPPNRDPAPQMGPRRPLASPQKDLLDRQQTDRLKRAEARSLSPPYLADVKRRMAAERAVEENLARGRRITRHEIRRATDPRRMGRDRPARFPRPECSSCHMVRVVLAGVAVLTSPFMLYFLVFGTLALL